MTFTDAAMIEASWGTYVSRGALAVRPLRPLRPLEQLEVYLLGGGIPSPIAVRVEVVHLDAERALLRLLDVPPAKPELPVAPAASAPDSAPAAAPAEAPPDAPPPAEPAPPPAPPPTDDAALAELIVQSVPPASRTSELDAIDLMPSPDGRRPPPRVEAPPVEATPPPTPAPPPAEETANAAPPAAEAAPRTATPAVITLEPVEAAPRAVVFAEREQPAVVLEPMPAAEPLASTAPPPQPAPVPPPPAVAAMPPVFTGDALRFASDADYQAAHKDLSSIGAVLAVCDGRLPPSTVDVRLVVSGRETKTKVKITLAPAAAGTAVVQAAERGGFQAALAELDARSTLLPPTYNTGAIPLHEVQTSPSGNVAPKGFTLPRSGTLMNPVTAQGILAMPVLRTPTDAELARPSVPLLLRYLRTTRGVLRVEMTAADHPVFTFVIVDGREVRSAATLATLGKSLSLPQLSFSIIDLPRPPQTTHTARTLHLIAETVRGLCAQIPTEELYQAFPKRPDKLARAISDVVQGLGLPPQHMRFVKTDVDGSQFVDEIARAAVGQRTVWETMYLLELYNGLSWDEPPEDKKGGPRVSNQSGLHKLSQLVATDDAWAPFEGKDHFQVLGLHWSSSPTEVGPAFQKLRAEYGPNGPKRPADAKVAEKIMKRLEEANRVLSDAGQRRAHRRERYNLQWAHQAQLLVQKAKLAIYRKDYQDATNILLAAEDMAPSEEAKALLAQIKQKTQKK